MDKMTSLYKKRYILVNLVYLIVLIAIFLISAEYICRKKGMLPWIPGQIGKINITVIPGGKLYAKNSTLGYNNLPGQFKIILPDGYYFTQTNLENTHRITHNLEAYTTQHVKPEIWIFGCSFTNGWALNDQETYPWLLQEKLPQYEIVNFGVNGYGTLSGLVQFKEALIKYPPPKIAILTYSAWLHDNRNTFSRSRRKTGASLNFLGSMNLPYARLFWKTLQIKIDALEYRPFPLMQYSAFSHFLENRFNTIEAHFYRDRAVAKAIISEFDKVAKEYGVQLILAGLTADPDTYDTLEYSNTLDIITVDMSVNLDIKENTNPHDFDHHPSAQANKQYAEKLFNFIDSQREELRLTR